MLSNRSKKKGQAKKGQAKTTTATTYLWNWTEGTDVSSFGTAIPHIILGKCWGCHILDLECHVKGTRLEQDEDYFMSSHAPLITHSGTNDLGTSSSSLSSLTASSTPALQTNAGVVPSTLSPPTTFLAAPDPTITTIPTAPPSPPTTFPAAPDPTITPLPTAPQVLIAPSPPTTFPAAPDPTIIALPTAPLVPPSSAIATGRQETKTNLPRREETPFADTMTALSPSPMGSQRSLVFSHAGSGYEWDDISVEGGDDASAGLTSAEGGDREGKADREQVSCPAQPISSVNNDDLPDALPYLVQIQSLVGKVLDFERKRDDRDSLARKQMKEQYEEEKKELKVLAELAEQKRRGAETLREAHWRQNRELKQEIEDERRKAVFALEKQKDAEVRLSSAREEVQRMEQEVAQLRLSISSLTSDRDVLVEEARKLKEEGENGLSLAHRQMEEERIKAQEKEKHFAKMKRVIRERDHEISELKKDKQGSAGVGVRENV
ncbi:hypothetical protein L198_00257 [Cryptococcus wingfieldii CBS 7118]|uniref:Uncharacterized protein n=1 Tax=Cryptococcus wingfieldii CBS 7118 TaxID=1295528 RepID=A0A1E3K7L6_9TREE|nr:hypothetical protein L198_00257 [Cryptococcus wingfieldii CBS 7118]ODO08527.1 hypothetical protein L198_00257 [Cryptococcus wingfieldii CBS 7118]